MTMSRSRAPRQRGRNAVNETACEKGTLSERLKSHTWARPGVSAAGINGIGMLAIRNIPEGTEIFEKDGLVSESHVNHVQMTAAELDGLNKSVAKYVKDVIAPDLKDGTYHVPKCGLNGLDFSFFVNTTHSKKLSNVKYGDDTDQHTSFLKIVASRTIKRNEELLLWIKDPHVDPRKESANAYNRCESPDSSGSGQEEEVDTLMSRRMRLFELQERMTTSFKTNTSKLRDEITEVTQQINTIQPPPVSLEAGQTQVKTRASLWGYPAPEGKDEGKTGLAWMEDDQKWVLINIGEYMPKEKRGRSPNRRRGQRNPKGGKYLITFAREEEKKRKRSKGGVEYKDTWDDQDFDYCSDGDTTVLVWKVKPSHTCECGSRQPLDTRRHKNSTH